MRKILILVGCFIPLLCLGETKILPVEYFGSLPDVSRMQLSPDGNKLASVIRVDAGDKHGTAIQVVDLNTKEKKIVLFTDNKMFDLNWIRWKGNTTLLVGIFFAEVRTAAKALHKIKVRETRLLIVDTDKATYHESFSKSFLKQSVDRNPPVDLDSVVDFLDEDADHIYMEYEGSVYSVNIKNQSTKIVFPWAQSPFLGSWITDRQHEVRIGYTLDDDGTYHIKLRDAKSNKWKELWSYKNFSSDEIDPLGFGLDPNILYINAYFQGRKAIFKVNIDDAELKRELIYADPKYDIEGSLIYSNNKKEVVGIYLSGAGRALYFDPSLQKLQAGINKALPSTWNHIISLSDDEQKYVVFSASDTNAGTYLLGDRKKGALDVIALRYKELIPSLMVGKKIHKYKARDGLEIESFLSLPKDREAKALPLIVLPHGGPISSDDDDFDTWVQFLANRGYAVLQMNYRGSSGRGLSFQNAGLKNWGLQMQDDIEDGARSLIADGTADANSIAIVGASYGGYAALEGVVKTPNFYKCAVSVAGVSNVSEFAVDRRYGSNIYNEVDQQIGTDYKHLDDVSPVNHADQIRVPVLLIHGDSDRQVEPKHSQEMFEKLKKYKKNVTYIELLNEDHYLTDNNNRLITFKAIDEFLATYLPVKH